MAKYLVKSSYTAEGTKGLLKEGGTSRKAIVETTSLLTPEEIDKACKRSIDYRPPGR
ncbi:MAG: hypothetical protein OES69_06730 [Myxococcales bacterium]|nr:hypothetical protein [Myxococcales bacterium]MDH3843615.1 hypothetical protein [Myxococcales bacterium]